MYFWTDGLFGNQLGGESPQIIRRHVDESMLKKEFRIMLGFSDLPEGEECPYTIKIWYDYETDDQGDY